MIDEETGAARTTDKTPTDETLRALHRTIDAVRSDMAALRFNTAVARLFELNNHLTQVVGESGGAPASVVEPLVLMVAPLAPHIAEELWSRLGHDTTLTFEEFPEADPAYLATDEVEVPVQVNGKVRARVKVPVGADDAAHEAAARSDEKVLALLEGRTVRKTVVVPGRMVNFVVASPIGGIDRGSPPRIAPRLGGVADGVIAR